MIKLACLTACEPCLFFTWWAMGGKCFFW